MPAVPVSVAALLLNPCVCVRQPGEAAQDDEDCRDPEGFLRSLPERALPGRRSRAGQGESKLTRGRLYIGGKREARWNFFCPNKLKVVAIYQSKYWIATIRLKHIFVNVWRFW